MTSSDCQEAFLSDYDKIPCFTHVLQISFLNRAMKVPELNITSDLWFFSCLVGSVKVRSINSRVGLLELGFLSAMYVSDNLLSCL